MYIHPDAVTFRHLRLYSPQVRNFMCVTSVSDTMDVGTTMQLEHNVHFNVVGVLRYMASCLWCKLCLWNRLYMPTLVLYISTLVLYIYINVSVVYIYINLSVVYIYINLSVVYIYINVSVVYINISVVYIYQR